ncbi:hypothetical protein NC653_024414 [Populus alba x Populus x berolinensis]|uniref:50S ribosomal protein L33, chloroplastic n=1 Tax=Populus alba x Populus x berolinensis TaxID=444605 RepID=A0AAD6M9N5_9ROSI|nr:hypothetical protein NC653_024414 [Populus alba x Populus x berolinensis]
MRMAIMIGKVILASAFRRPTLLTAAKKSTKERIMRELIMVLIRQEWKLKKDALMSLKFRGAMISSSSSLLVLCCIAMGDKKKKTFMFIRLVSAAGTGFFYVKRKSAKKALEKLEFRKYDPRVNRHGFLNRHGTPWSGFFVGCSRA